MVKRLENIHSTWMLYPVLQDQKRLSRVKVGNSWAG